MDHITTSLLLTALGMGLVFSMIVLLWGLIALLAHNPTHRSTIDASDHNQHMDETERKRKAAAIAVALAFAQKEQIEPHEFPLPPTALVSAWQAVMRSEMLKKRGHRR